MKSEKFLSARRLQQTTGMGPDLPTTGYTRALDFVLGAELFREVAEGPVLPVIPSLAPCHSEEPEATRNLARALVAEQSPRQIKHCRGYHLSARLAFTLSPFTSFRAGSSPVIPSPEQRVIPSNARNLALHGVNSARNLFGSFSKG